MTTRSDVRSNPLSASRRELEAPPHPGGTPPPGGRWAMSPSHTSQITKGGVLAYGRVLRTLRTDQTVWNHPVLSGRLRGMRRRDFLKGMAALLPVASVLGSSRGPRRDLVSAEYLVDSNQGGSHTLKASRCLWLRSFLAKLIGLRWRGRFGWIPLAGRSPTATPRTGWPDRLGPSARRTSGRERPTPAADYPRYSRLSRCALFVAASQVVVSTAPVGVSGISA